MSWSAYIWIPVAVVLIAIIVGSLYFHSVRDRRIVEGNQRAERGLGQVHGRAKRNAERIKAEHERQVPKSPAA